jgi:hypothetical protein
VAEEPVIPRVTRFQSVRAIVLSGLLWLTVVGGSCGGCAYYFFGYPKTVARDAIAGVRVGQGLEEVLADDRPFMQQLAKNQVGQMMYFRGGSTGTLCGVLKREKSGSFQYVASIAREKAKTEEFSGSAGARKFFENRREELSACDRLDADFMPALFYRCTVNVRYDSQFRVTATALDHCWD